MKLSEFKKKVIEIYGKEAWEEIEESYIYKKIYNGTYFIYNSIIICIIKIKKRKEL